MDVLTHAKVCWVQTPSLSLAGIVSSLLGKELPTDPTFRLSRWNSPLNAQLVILVTVVCSARVLFTLVVFCRTFLVASFIVGTMLLNLLVVGGMSMMPAFENPYGAVTGRVHLPGCSRVRSCLRGDRDIEGSHTRPGSDHFAAGNIDEIEMRVPHLSRPYFLHNLNQQHARHISITSN